MKSEDVKSTLTQFIDELTKLFDIVRSGYEESIKTYINYFPPTISSLLLGRSIFSLEDLKEVVDELARFSMSSDPSIKNLATLSIYELRILLNSIISKSFLNPMDINEAKTYALKLISGISPGLIVVVGDDPLTLEKLLSKAQRLGFVIFVVSNRFREIFEGGLVIDGRRGLIKHVSIDPIDGLVYSIGLAIRLLSISGYPVERGNIHEYLGKRIRMGIALLTISKPIESTLLNAISDLGICIVTSAELGYGTNVIHVDRIEDVLSAICSRLGILEILEKELPIGFSSVYEGKSVRDRDVYVEFGNIKPYFELVVSRKLEDVVDGSVEVIGLDIDSMTEGSIQPIGILVEVAGVRMKKEYEPVIERSIHRVINYGEETWHVGQRYSGWIRITRRGVEKGFKLRHLGLMLYVGLKRLYGDIVDRLQVKIYTDEALVTQLLEIAKTIYDERDRRLVGLIDEDVGRYYACTMCQSFLSNHVCIITPERPGLCGTVTYIDAEVAYELRGEASGIRSIERGKPIDVSRGEWDGVNKAISQLTHGAINRVSLYSLVSNPTTSTLSFECISVFIPECNGIMVVDYSYRGETPIGLSFSTLAGMISGLQMPGFLGHSRRWILSRKYFRAEDGVKRIVWMPSSLKETLGEEFRSRCVEEGVPDLPEKIADENTARTLDELLEWLIRVKHPVLELPPILMF